MFDSLPFWRCERFGKMTAVQLAGGRSVSYAELLSSAGQNMLTCPARRLVALRCNASPVTLAVYLGCLRQRIVPLLLDRDLPADQVAEVVQRFHAAAVWDENQGWQTTDLTSPELHPDLAVLLMTSGSTGRPRCVRLSYANIDANAQAIAAYLELTSAERPMLTLPWSSAFGLSVVHSHWSVGATLLLPNSTIVEREFWDQFRSQAATSLAGVPFTFAQLKRLRLERLRLPSLRLLLQAGGRLSPELVRHFSDMGQQLGFRFFVMYGQTEATARMAYLRPENATQKPTSIGKAIPGGTLTVRDENGQPQLEPEQVGELFYRGPNVMLGYADTTADLALGSVTNGEIATGDLGYRDKDGDFYVAGRLSRFVKLEGKRVHLDAIEETLNVWGYEALAVGDDSQVTVAVRSRAAGECPLTELQQRLAAHFRVNQVWFSVQNLLAIPYLSNGKVDYWSFAARHARAAHAK